jgi:hypothetical protein
MSIPHRRVPGTLVGATAGLLLLLPLTACSSDNVSCSGKQCSATLSGSGAEASFFGTDLAFAGTKDGTASISVGDTSYSCTQGESLTAGPLSLTCTTVTEDSLTITAALG